MNVTHHDDNIALINALHDKRDQEQQRQRDAGIRCPHCKGVTVVIAQYEYSTQRYSEEDDWGSSDYGEGSISIAARCANYGCEADLTAYMLRKGWSFSHDIDVPNRSHRKPTKKERRLLPDLDASDPQLQNAIDEYRARLGRLLDERERRAQQRRLPSPTTGDIRI